MAGSPGKRVLHTSPGSAPCTDRLSDLPEGVLHRIMSFLTSRQAVRTCVLSKRWRYLWRSVPCINAYYKQFEVTDSKAGDGEALALFKRFVNRLMELGDPVASIDKFCLWYSISYDHDDDTEPQDAIANRWISQALQKKARVVEVYVDLVYADLCPLVIDHSVFTSSYLTKILFSNVIPRDGFFKQLETGCPALEDLSFHYCFISAGEISSQTLKVLTIKDTKFCVEQKISISTPNVTSLTLWSPMDGIVVLKDMASVVIASVKPSVFSNEFDARGLRQYLWALSGVKNLEFYYRGEKLTIQNSLQWCPKFFNLVGLTLGHWCLHGNFYALIVFLQNSPRLEKLILILGKDHWKTFEGIIGGKLEERSFTCEHLMSVEVRCSEDDPMVINMADLFVNSGMSSTQIHIKYWS